jgi:ribA/ribD-fused uncharacterized protein
VEQTYHLKWLTDKCDNEEQLKFLFFWGHFNKSGEEIGKFCFSQWYNLPFVVDNVSYNTAEHWMMANKALLFEDFNTFDKIIACKKPGQAKELGREVLRFDEITWKARRSAIVITGNIHKFNQHQKHLEYLISTHGRILVEASPTDKVWGIGLGQGNEYIENPYFWNGENLLGFALMEVRDFFVTFGSFEYLKAKIELPWKAIRKLIRKICFGGWGRQRIYRHFC